VDGRIGAGGSLEFFVGESYAREEDWGLVVRSLGFGALRQIHCSRCIARDESFVVVVAVGELDEVQNLDSAAVVDHVGDSPWW
jgi:hypothetical protein